MHENEDFCSECGSELSYPRIKGLCYECFCLNSTDEEIKRVDNELAKEYTEE